MAAAVMQLAGPDPTVEALVVAQQISQRSKRGKKPSVRDLSDKIADITDEDTMAGASTLTVQLIDPSWSLLDGGWLDADADDKLDPIDLNYPKGSKNWWRLQQLTLSDDPGAPQIGLVFIERPVAYMMARKTKKAHKVSRSGSTRAQFVHWLVIDAGHGIEFRCKELSKKQPIKHQSQKKSDSDKKDDKDSGVPEDADLKIAGGTAGVDQIKQINRSLAVADSLNASPKVIKAMLVAGIGESGFKPIPNTQGSGYEGVFQADPKNIDRTDTEGQAHYFLAGGKGFQVGGAIQAREDHPDWSVGMIATKVEASGQPASFYDVCPPGASYNGAAEADAIMDLYTPGGGDTITYTKQFNFARNANETSWDCADRLASDVTWRVFCDGNIIYLDSDTTLIKQQPSLTLKRGDKRILSLGPSNWDVRKIATGLEIELICDPDDFRAGEVFKLIGFGPFSQNKYKGAWLISEISGSRFARSRTFTLAQPAKPKKEPAAEPGTRTFDEGGGTTGGDTGTMATGIDASAVATSGGGAYGASRGYGGHAGVDIAMPEGTALVALCAGEIACVSHTWYNSSDGKGTGMVSIKSSERVGKFERGTIFGYGHPDTIYVKKGDKVSAGDKLALSGNPGGGPHLHFFINTAGEACANGNTDPTSLAKDLLGS